MTVIVVDESRYQHTETWSDSDGRLLTTDRNPVRFRERDDNIIHVAAEGDSWFSLAQLYYDDISDRACGLFWVIMDYQPTPVIDPTLAIRPRTQVVVPSPLFVLNVVLRTGVTVYL